MINQTLNALQSKSAYVSELNKNEFFIEFKTNMNSKIIATIQKGSNHVDFNNLSNGVYFRSYIKEADLMAMIYYINEYGVAKSLNNAQNVELKKQKKIQDMKNLESY